MSNINYAAAKITGSEKYSDIYGMVTFSQTDMGVKVSAEIFNLPMSENVCGGVEFNLSVFIDCCRKCDYVANKIVCLIWRNCNFGHIWICWNTRRRNISVICENRERERRFFENNINAEFMSWHCDNICA